MGGDHPGPGGVAPGILSEHRRRLLSGATALEPIELGLLEAHGCVLAAEDAGLPAGRRLGAADVALLAAAGRTRAWVRPRPRAVVLSAGEREPGDAGPPAVSYMVVAMVRDAGATAYHQTAPHGLRELLEAVEGALAQADLLLSCGGLADDGPARLPAMLERLGEVEVGDVGLSPGGRQASGRLGQVPYLGLSDQPVGACVGFEMSARPLIRRLQGRDDVARPRLRAVLDARLAGAPGTVSFVPVRLRRGGGEWHAAPTTSPAGGAGEHGTDGLRALSAADGLAELPSDRGAADAGERLLVHLLVDPS